MYTVDNISVYTTIQHYLVATIEGHKCDQIQIQFFAHLTKCVTIQTTLDGRLQVAGRNGFLMSFMPIMKLKDLYHFSIKFDQTMAVTCW